MSASASQELDPRASFWTRAQLAEIDRMVCLEALQENYPGYRVEEHEYQGYCSYTWLLSPQTTAERAGRQLVVQVRPARYKLRLDIARAAREVYGALAPEVRAVDVCLPGGLVAYEMGRVEGTPLSLLLHENAVETDRRTKQRTLVTSFAHLVAQSWPGRKAPRRRDSVVQSSPLPRSVKDSGMMLSPCTGKVGSQIVPKLRKLAQELPDRWLRARAQETLNRIQKIDDYPVVLNHGDLIPSNMLVNEDTCNITGLVDWAEAEFLPFGTCLYGLEHLLGTLVSAPRDGRTSWVYRYSSGAQELRDLFYNTLTSLVPELKHRQEELWLMRDIGVFLWHGYAWDDGAIDRVVDEANDGEELAKLRAMLSV
jgi:aminoglycoside phosphotransferase (APT) family kinase protein